MKKLSLLLVLTALPLAVCAADVTGTWKAEFDSQIGLQKYTFTFQQDGAKLTGKAQSEVNDRRRETELLEGKVVGDAISFVELLNFQGNEIRITYNGTVSADGNEIKFTRRVGDFATTQIVAKRQQTAPTAAQVIRINAGRFTPYTDSKGNVWLPDQGFEGGNTVEHDPPVEITGTDEPGLFQSEHYSMEWFSWKLPNGKYIAKLYFCETYAGITGPGERVFSFNVHGHEFKDFDVWVKAGGPYRAYVVTVPVEVTNGEFRIVFTPQIENPQINAIEIIPESLATATGTAPTTSAPSSTLKPIRINAGRFTPYTDSKGNVWLPDQGFEGGNTVEHDPPVEITGTDEPGLFQSEHYSMEWFSWKLPNGKYIAKLYFCETYAGITGPGERVFSFNVHGHEFKDFDVWVKAGGPYRAYVVTVPVEVTNGEFRIVFTPQIENPQINAIEIIPEPLAATAVSPAITTTVAKPPSEFKPVRINAGRFTPYTDSEGNVWLPDQGFEGGETVERDPSIQIANTKDPELFRTERYLMDAFTYKLPNGKYTVKLYFAETYEGIGGPGERVFSFNVQGKEFKDFDIWVKAGGPYRAYVETVSVEITNRQLKITFTPKIENPAINAIEIIPESITDTEIPWPGTTATNVPPGRTVQTREPAPQPQQLMRPAKNPVLYIDAGRVTGNVSPTFYGLMTEEINFSYEGGLYGELIRNRTFKADAVVPRVTPTNYVAGEYVPVTFRPNTKPRFWSEVGGASMVLDTNNPLNKFLNVSLKLDVSSASAASPAGVANGGYWGIPVRPNTTYRVSFFAKAAGGFKGPVTVSIESADGKTTFASAKISGLTTEWKKFDTTLKTGRVPVSKDNVFKLTTTTPGTIWLQNVSLFPPTYKNRKNGLRPDIMELLADLKPKFLRFPGGNYLEGNALNQRFNWKETIGPVEERPGHPSPWGYWSTDGLGLLEFAQWCEDLNMEPVLGVFAGYCLGRGGVIHAGPELEPYVQEALEQIEYLIGDPKTTKWGALRAKHGHPKPFKLRYVEIGNEDFFDRSGSYDGRFAQFYDAIKAKYPHLKVISSIGYEQPQNLWVKSRTPDLVDEHYYRNMEEMMAQAFRYDTYSRTNPTKIFVGEWATRVGSPTPNMAGALGDAAWMTCMERNADIVVMHCYAPLFVNVSQLTGPNRSMQWASDLIGYDALTSYGSPAYYAQKMFSTMLGDEVLATDSAHIPTRLWQPQARRGQSPPPPREIREIFFSATRDSKTGLVFVKVVNTTGSAQPINIQLKGVKKVQPRGEAVVLAGASLEDTNSIENPKKIIPRTEKITGLSTNFTRVFPAYSVSVLKIKTR